MLNYIGDITGTKDQWYYFLRTADGYIRTETGITAYNEPYGFQPTHLLDNATAYHSGFHANIAAKKAAKALNKPVTICPYGHNASPRTVYPPKK